MTPKEIKKLLKKYMIEKDPNKAHAVLSASGSERWLNCAASVKLSEGIPNEDNEHSIAGTQTHTLLQFMLENPVYYRLILNSRHAEEFKKFINYTDQKFENATFAKDYVLAEKKRMEKETGQPVQLLVEQKVELKGVGFGTSDVILYQPFGLLHVMDYKNGQKAVEPEDNDQGLYYAVAAADLFGWDFSRVAITIIQPNASNKRGPIRTWNTDDSRLIQARKRFRDGAKNTKDPKAEFGMGSWCWFCPARRICPQQIGIKELKIMDKFIRPTQKSFCEQF